MDEDTEEYESHEDGKSSISADLIRGHINTIILRSLYDRDKYGYEIITEINEKSHGQYTLKQPTLYSALKRLENQGYIQAYWKTDEVSMGGRRKYFRLTESGKEMTEKNQAEWEYSRTVIDNLISDKNFDFSQPAPTPVDFKYLKQSTSRVPTVRSEDGEEIKTEEKTQEEQTENKQTEETVVTEEKPAEEKPTEEAATEEKTTEEKPVEEQAAQEKPAEEKPVVQVITTPFLEAITFTAYHETSVILQPEEVYSENSEEKTQPEEKAEEQTEPEEQAAQETTAETEQQPETETEPTAAQPVYQDVINVQPQPEPAPQPVQEQPVYRPSALEIAAEEERRRVENQQQEEQRRLAHENYVKLISGEYDKKPEPQEAPAAENINTENLIYNTRPETERDYRNLIDRLFVNALKPNANENSNTEPAYEEQPQPQPPVQEYAPVQPKPRFYSANEKAATDGLKIYTADNQSYSAKAKQTTYNKGATLFKCSLIVGVIILLEFTLCLLFKDSLNVSLAYPFVILALGLTDILVCGILFGAGFGKQVRKPTNLRYIITSIIVTAILMVIIILFAVVLSVNWSSTPDVLAKVVVPCIIALNIPVFTLSFYVFTK